jgi:hypothetical protein
MPPMAMHPLLDMGQWMEVPQADVDLIPRYLLAVQ